MSSITVLYKGWAEPLFYRRGEQNHFSIEGVSRITVLSKGWAESQYYWRGEQNHCSIEGVSRITVLSKGWAESQFYRRGEQNHCSIEGVSRITVLLKGWAESLLYIRCDQKHSSCWKYWTLIKWHANYLMKSQPIFLGETLLSCCVIVVWVEERKVIKCPGPRLHAVAWSLGLLWCSFFPAQAQEIYSKCLAICQATIHFRSSSNQ